MIRGDDTVAMTRPHCREQCLRSDGMPPVRRDGFPSPLFPVLTMLKLNELPQQRRYLRDVLAERFSMAKPCSWERLLSIT